MTRRCRAVLSLLGEGVMALPSVMDIYIDQRGRPFHRSRSAHNEARPR